MKSDSLIKQGLNSCLKDQLTAINQLFLHARIAKNWGLEGLNQYEYERSIVAMKAADILIKRILFLEGLPNMQDAGKLMIGDSVEKMLDGDMRMLGGIRANLQNVIKGCEEVRDYVSRDELQEILEETEEHIDWLETQHWLIANTGLENYLQAQLEA